MAQKFKVEIVDFNSSRVVKISGRPAFTTTAKKFKPYRKKGKKKKDNPGTPINPPPAQGGNPPSLNGPASVADKEDEDRRHVIGYANILRPCCELIMTSGLSTLTDGNLIGTLRAEYARHQSLLTKPPAATKTLREHVEYTMRQLNSVVNNLNLGSAVQNQASESFRDEAEKLRDLLRECLRENLAPPTKMDIEPPPTLSNSNSHPQVSGQIDEEPPNSNPNAPVTNIFLKPGTPQQPPPPPSPIRGKAESYREQIAQNERDDIYWEARLNDEEKLYRLIFRKMVAISEQTFALKNDPQGNSAWTDFINADKEIFLSILRGLAGLRRVSYRFRVQELLDIVDDFEFSTATDISPTRQSIMQTRFALHFSDLMRRTVLPSNTEPVDQQIAALFHFFHMPPADADSDSCLAPGCVFCDQLKTWKKPAVNSAPLNSPN